ncbi:MAG: hypothetical protein UR85_C0008G0025 [Candidatus Nomurabacteria bacterium GW2011_GWF2_35_66]|uniref:Uncharacterized protein n=1 Tax=Candidatus Nomurabacteria bacterium GW2011_GWE1_35_16 TaxID=1618761 RepID=A0A0G0DTF1_9BACT|nr:MAG: hypothetical protein UR55_C0011G0025 [Candidatus Nomurabacteria bacterium GW2011_GWF1_34_20]KKP62861.1 MAG: hypothetical protein UR57_C0010G0025 [Candidatus Nomurabacteria bacterium GW2011_GWE2_34_25]KKP66260.1 MAG: hypothetical protein UR64_C0010G0025 [Candidatus Nomurabacteria bacterium GW2011_GWE1_35_16]KKP83092.1 MAG: hypothetical protein UR85_C0008G0025 [Candidatus Nomurabacteria bacterium GW2011_GWF2_35_66]HAE36687.1 hypothetical protein [Candidatus Nomurabacteria bacterium]
MRKYFIFFILIYFIFIPSYSFGATLATGFIPGQIWYSKDPFIEGDTVKIYTALWNSSFSSLSAKVEFYDKNVILGSRDVVVPALKLQDVSVSWKVTSGDHLISAKIISPSTTTSGKKEAVIVTNTTTEIDKRFVPVVLTTAEGKPATSSDVLKSQIDKATSSVDDIVPLSISTPVSKNIGLIDNFREDAFKKISATKIETKDRIDEINKIENKTTTDKTSTVQNKVGVEDATEKPITYLKLIFLSILSFIFGSKLVFYAIIVFLVFLIVRFIYRKIRNRY